MYSCGNIICTEASSLYYKRVIKPLSLHMLGRLFVKLKTTDTFFDNQV